MNNTDAPLAPVLVFVDRGDSGAAVRYGAAEATRTLRPLRLVHVSPSGDRWLIRVGRDSLRLANARAAGEVAGRVLVQSTHLCGGTRDEAVALADSAALVVLEQLPPGNHRLPMESDAVVLASVTDTPVVVVPTSWVERRRGVVTVGLDTQAADDTAVRAAITLARLRGDVLRVVVAGGASRADADTRLERLGGDGCDLAVELTAAPPASALASAATSSDLLVVGRHHPRPPDHSRLGSLARELLAAASCPVLLTAPGHVHPDSQDPRIEEGPAVPAHARRAS
jgi:hypothetical protein